MDLFNNDQVNFDILKKRAFNYRWAEVEDGIIPLTAADPDFMASDKVRGALIDYINGGYFSYTPKLGLPDFLEAISKKLAKKNEFIDKELILPIDSAARALFVVAQSILEEGDEAIVFNPVDFLFRHAINKAKGKVIEYPFKIVDGKIDISDIEDYITPKTKMIGLCNPHNPVGLLYEEDVLKKLLDLAVKYDLYIMNDEIWSDITYPEKDFLSILSVDESKNDRVVSLFGFSKSYGLAGLRIGCIYTHNKDMFKKVVENSDVLSTAGGISSLSQIAGIACINEAEDWLNEFKEHLRKQRDYAYERINSMPMLSCRLPEATYMLYVDISRYNMKSEEFTDFIKEKTKVALIPGGETFFGSNSEGYIRICYATSRAILKEGLDRLEEGLKLLNKE